MYAVAVFAGSLLKEINMWCFPRTEQLEKIRANYVARVARSWFGPNKTHGGIFVVGAVALVLLAMVVNSWVRQGQLDTWESSPHISMIDGAPAFSTTDAPFFLLHAASIQREEASSTVDSIRLFPNLTTDIASEQQGDSLLKRPFLSLLISILADSPDPADLLRSGNELIIWSAALTALMIAVCFGAAGYWLEGAVAGLGGGLSTAYLTRTAIGRIDTDQLNLGFMYLLFGLVIFAGEARTRARALALCFVAGLSARLFTWWYYKPELIVIVAVALAFVLIVRQRSLLSTATGTLMFIALSGIGIFNPLETPYLKEVLSGGNFIFPNTFQTITEMRQFSSPQALRSVAGSTEMGFFCLAGLTLFAVRHPVLALTYGPLAGFGLLNFVVGNRAVFYAAPLFWFGAAFLVTTLGRFITSNLSQDGNSIRHDRTAAIVGGCLAMVVAWVNSPTNYVPNPSFPKPVIEGFAFMKVDADPEKAVVATWWDYGYASMFLNDLPTLHDGGTQTTPTTHFVAHALLNPEIYGTVGTLKFLSTKGHAGIAAEKDQTGLNSAFDGALSSSSPDLYLVVTGQMAGWMGSISTIGNWDIEKGQPISLRNNPDGPRVHYRRLNCRFNDYPRSLICQGVEIDLQRGLLNGRPLLVGWTHTRDGSTLRGRSFDHDADHAIQIVQDGNSITVFMLHRQLYESTFNRLYYQGLMEHPSISLHYDDYPHIRIYKVDGTPPAQANKS